MRYEAAGAGAAGAGAAWPFAPFAPSLPGAPAGPGAPGCVMTVVDVDGCAFQGCQTKSAIAARTTIATIAMMAVLLFDPLWGL